MILLLIAVLGWEERSLLYTAIASRLEVLRNRKRALQLASNGGVQEEEETLLEV